MLTALTKYSLKGVFRNRALWAFAGGFMLFWLLLGSFGYPKPTTSATQQLTVATWFGMIALFGLSFIAINIARTIGFASPALAYSFRFTKLKPRSYLSALIVCSSVMGIAIIVAALGMSYGLFSASYSVSMAPNNPIWALIVSAIVGVFMMAFAVLLMLVAVNYLGLRSVNLVIFLPLILVTALSNLQLNTVLPPEAIYASPFNSILSVLYGAYSGATAYAQPYNSATAALQPEYLLASILVWTLALLFADIYLLKRVRPGNPEEGRPI